MKKKCNYFLLFKFFILVLSCPLLAYKDSALEFVPALSSTPVTKPMRILHVLLSATFGGIHQQTLYAYKKLHANGYEAFMLIPNNSKLEDELKKQSFGYYKCDVLKDLKRLKEDRTYPLPKRFCERLYGMLLYICKKHNIDIIHCHKPWEYYVAQKVAHDLGISVIAHYHTHIIPHFQEYKNFDAFVGSSPLIVDYMKEANTENNLNIKQIEFIHPPHDEERFLNFVPSSSKKVFFEQNFGIEIKKMPIICMIGNLQAYKNHSILFQALHELIYKHKVQAQLVLAGFGRLEDDLKDLVSSLKIQDYVHFLGFTPLVPELLYHSDIKILPSTGEAFGIVLLEAALMKKPIILSKTAAVANILIKHEDTGLLCDPNDPSDIALQIKRLIQDKKLGLMLAENVFSLVREKFSAIAAFAKTENLYKKIYKGVNGR